MMVEHGAILLTDIVWRIARCL